jgi:hypothetical protein
MPDKTKKLLKAVETLYGNCSKNTCLHCFFGSENGKMCRLDDTPPYKWHEILAPPDTWSPLETYEGLFDEDDEDLEARARALELELECMKISDHDALKMYEVPLNSHEDPFPNCYAGCLEEDF